MNKQHILLPRFSFSDLIHRGRSGGVGVCSRQTVVWAETAGIWPCAVKALGDKLALSEAAYTFHTADSVRGGQAELCASTLSFGYDSLAEPTVQACQLWLADGT